MKQLPLLLLLLTLYGPAFSKSCQQTPVQNNSISGIVLDAKTKLPISLASIRFMQKGSGTFSDESGKFSISTTPAQALAKLQISFIGYHSQDYSVTKLLQKSKKEQLIFYLVPSSKNLLEVHIKAKAPKLKITQVGHNIKRFSPFEHTYPTTEEPFYKTSGQELAIKIQAKSYPVFLKNFNFCLSGNGTESVKIGFRLYNIHKNQPAGQLLPQKLVVHIPPHHTGWININLEPYTLTLHQDFAVGIEWLNESNKLNENWLALGAYKPKKDIIYYKDSPRANWRNLTQTSLGMYVTLVNEK